MTNFRLAALLMASMLMAPLAQASVTLKLATVAPEGSSWMREMRAAAEQVEATTEGRVKVRFYPGAVMGNDVTVLRKIRLGQLQGAALTGSELGSITFDAQLYSLPFLFRDRAEVDAVREAIDPMIFASIEKSGWKVLSLSGVGFAYLMSTKSIGSTEELRQRKVWVPQNDEIAERVYRAGKVAPIPLSLPDVFTSLQTGLVDTVGNTPSGAIVLQWHSSMREVLDLPLSYITGFVLISDNAWRRIDDADQTNVLAAFKAAGERIDAGNLRADTEAMQALEKLGVERIEISEEEQRYWERIGRQVMQELKASGELTAAPLDAVLRLLEERRAAESSQAGAR